MSAPVLELVAGFEASVDNNYAFYDEALYDDGSTYAPDVIEHDITTYARDKEGFTVTRGVSSIVTQGFTANAGTYSGTLSNRDRRFDPNYFLGAPYFQNADTTVVPGVPIILRVTYPIPTIVADDLDVALDLDVPVDLDGTPTGTQYTLFTGYADDWPQTYPEVATDQVVQLNATDFTAKMAAANLSITRPVEYSGARIDAVLDAMGYSGPRSIAHGNTIISALTRGTVSALSHVSDVVMAEWGDFYIAKDGTVTFRGRDEIFSETRSHTSQATFGDNKTTELSCKSEMASAPIINRVVLTYSDSGAQVTSDDLVSQSDRYPWGLKSLALTLPFHEEGQAQQYADWIVQQYAYYRVLFTSIEFAPSRGVGKTSGIDNLFPQAFGRELGDRITVKKTMSVGPRLSSECFIRGITTTYSDHVWSSTKFTLQDASFTQDLAYYDVSKYSDGSVYAL